MKDEPIDLAALTPMLRQYYTLKAECQDAVLFFRMGDFYEIFGTDAEKIAPMLEIVLTSREKGPVEKSGRLEGQPGLKIPFCGVPHHSAKNYWLKLLRRGIKVAIADQIEDPSTAKGLVKRAVTRVYTPGLIDELEGLDAESPNYLMAIYQEPNKAGQWTALVVDVSTGELRVGVLDDLENLLEFIKFTAPKELLVRKFFAKEIAAKLQATHGESGPLLGDLPEAPLRDTELQRHTLQAQFGADRVATVSSGLVTGGEALVAAVLCYLSALKVPTAGLMRIKGLKDPDTMVLDETAVRDLEIFESARRRETEGTLFRVLNQTFSPMGARLLRRSLLQPLLQKSAIESRLAGVTFLFELGETKLSELRQKLKGFPDLERLSVRLSNGLVSPLDLARMAQALGQVQDLYKLLGEQIKQGTHPLSQVSRDLGAGQGVLELLSKAIESHPTPLGSGKGVFRSGYDRDLDQKRLFAQNGEELLYGEGGYQERLKVETGISSLKIKPQKNYGYLIEITKTHSSKVPSQFIQRQTMVNAERYTTPELQEFSENIDKAQENCIAREQELYRELLNELVRATHHFKTVSESVAYFDLLQSFAWQALKNSYVKPQWTERSELKLKGSRHPVVETFVGRHQFFANDIEIDASSQLLLITGPNMAGKSTLMRQVALTALMAQVGSYVPAQVAQMPVFDRIFTRVGASDDLVKGQSTFMVEMSEAAHILRQASKQSLVILDEVGRGTSTQDGLALAAAILADLAERIGCVAFFATHYHELVEFSAKISTIKAVQTEVIEQGDQVIFTHRLKPGATSSSYGIEVARIAGIPAHVLEQAKSIAGQHHPSVAPLGSGALPKKSRAQGTRNSLPPPLEDRGELLLEASEKVPQQLPCLDRLKGLNLYRTTPLQALNILAEIQSEILLQSNSRSEDRGSAALNS